jgi:hypothetical protein
MVNDAILRLRKASVRPYDFASRYSQLLELLWQRKDSETRENAAEDTAPVDSFPVTIPSRLSAPYDPQDDFSWLDLQAVGEFVQNDQVPTGFGFEVDAYPQFSTNAGREELGWNDIGWLEGDEFNRLF